MNDPTLDPEFASALRSELVATAAPHRSHSWRWVASVAAAALVAVAVGGIVQQVRPEPSAVPASPTPTSITANVEQLLAAQGTLLDTGTGMTLCNGFVLQSRPPGCVHTTPVTGITWEDVPWAETEGGVTFTEDTIIVGTFQGDTFAATHVFRADDPAAPQPPDTVPREDLPTLCDAPTRGVGASSYEVLEAAAEALPGYQAVWVSSNQVTWNVAVSEDVEGARSALAKVFGGELCVGTVEGPTDKALKDAQQALKPLMPDPAVTTMPAAAVWSASSSVSGVGTRLEVNVTRDTPDLLDQIESAVGPFVWRYTDVIPFFYPVGGDVTTDPSVSLAPATAPPPARSSNGPDPDSPQTTTQALLTCPEKAATDSYLVEVPNSTVPVDELTSSLVPEDRTPEIATLCRYVRSGEQEATLEGTKDLANPADLASLADLPAVGDQSGSCTQPEQDAHYYLLRLDYGPTEGSWVTIGASNVGGGCVDARNGHFISGATLGEDADTAWAEGSWPSS